MTLADVHKGAALGLGALIFVTLLLLPPPQGMPVAAWRVAAVALLMAAWWIGEALPVAVTALLPVLLFPVLGIMPLQATAAPYANPLIFLFMGGFLIALAVQRWDLHRRIALTVLSFVGTRQDRLVGGFMLATAFLSMWVSNTATTIMMLPIALSMVPLVSGDEDGSPFPVALLLSVAYAASIGGVGTLIGTPPNAFLAAFMLETYGVTIGFAQWLAVGAPLVVVMLVIAWWLMTRCLFSLRGVEVTGARDAIRRVLEDMGPLTRNEKWVAAVFAAVAALWVARPSLDAALPGLSVTDPGIAMAGALALFLIPAQGVDGEGLLNWEWAERLPWGVLILFGGGLSLAQAVSDSGLAAWLAAALVGLGAVPVILLVLAATALILLLTELSSNIATTAAFLPVIAALAVSIEQNPLLLAIPAALAASCAFMMPVATPPNAIVFSSGHVTVPQMVRAGIWLNITALAVILIVSYTLAFYVFGIQEGVLPAWAR